MGRVSCEHTGYPRQTLCIGFVPYGEIVKPILLEQIRIIDRVSSPMGKLLNYENILNIIDRAYVSSPMGKLLNYNKTLIKVDYRRFRPLWGNC